MYPKTAIVIGGSISGLLQGLQLKCNGSNVIVLEQDPSQTRHSQESGVHIGPNVISLLEKYDATGRPAAIFAEYMSVAWRKRLRVLNRPSPRYYSNWGCLYFILRANFDGMTSETVPKPPSPKAGDGIADYRPGCRAVGFSYDHDKGRVQVQYVDVLSGQQRSVTAEVVLAADGIHSTVRKLLNVSTQLEYAGYIAWRGTVPERLLSKGTVEYFSNRLNFSLMGGTYFVSYFIPTETGHMEPGERLLNWVWYFAVPENSDKISSIFTDINGRVHSNTIPQGLVNPTLWKNQIESYKAQMTGPIAEIVLATPRVFVTKVSDSQCSQSTFLDGRLVLVGDAYTGFRSHMGMATEQAARHCWQMDRVWRGEITQEQRDVEARSYAKKFVLLNRMVGFGGMERIWAVLKIIFSLALLLIGQKLGGI